MILRIKDANEALAQLRAELSTVQETVKAHAETVAALTVERDTLLDASKSSGEGHGAQLDELREQLSAARAQAALLAIEQATASDRAIEIVASAGFPVPVAAKADDSADLISQLNALPHGPARQQFINNHWPTLNH